MAKKKNAPIVRAQGGGDQPTTATITKSYAVRDKWLDIAKDNLVEFKSVDGEISDLKVNGQAAGGGGGDLKIAKVTVINNMANDAIQMKDTYFVDENGIGINTNWVYAGTSGIWSIIVYKDVATGGQLSVPYGTYIVAGNIEDEGDGYVLVSDDGTITIS